MIKIHESIHPSFTATGETPAREKQSNNKKPFQTNACFNKLN